MQPNSQVGLDPEFNDIRTWEPINGLSVVTIPAHKNIAHIVRILHPSRAWFVDRPAHSKPQCFAAKERLEKRLDLGARREIQAPQAPCTELHGRYSRPKELARNAKNPGKTM
jgi:hypothetical protein